MAPGLPGNGHGVTPGHLDQLTRERDGGRGHLGLGVRPDGRLPPVHALTQARSGDLPRSAGAALVVLGGLGVHLDRELRGGHEVQLTHGLPVRRSTLGYPEGGEVLVCAHAQIDGGPLGDPCLGEQVEKGGAGVAARGQLRVEHPVSVGNGSGGHGVGHPAVAAGPDVLARLGPIHGEGELHQLAGHHPERHAARWQLVPVLGYGRFRHGNS